MIQRIQSLYLLVSILVCLLMFYLPLGLIQLDPVVKFSVCGFFNLETGEMLQFNWLLSSILSLTMVLQLITIFLFKNRTYQSIFGQISLILIAAFVALTLMYQDLFSIVLNEGLVDELIDYNWNIILIAIAWISTYLAIRAIKRDDALVKSADRMR